MKVKVIAQTKSVHLESNDIKQDFPDVQNAKILSGYFAAFCYMNGNFDSIVAQGKEKALKRLENCRKSGHHSVMDHVSFSLRIEECPKILAMILNNEKMYATSEKSARYTVMKTEGLEKKLYEKWIDIFQEKILEVYPEIDNIATLKGKKVMPSRKLAQENARYLISVFTPATTMAYSTSWRQIQYLLNWIDNFEDNFENNPFNIKLNGILKDFASELNNLGFEPLDDGKGRTFSLLAKRVRNEEFGENYSVNYKATFAELAQAQRHRTLAYEIMVPNDNSMEFYIPEIIRNDEQLLREWINDISSLSNNFPQGCLISINERGIVEDFISKCQERLCGHAQLEIARQTADTVKKYYNATKNNKYINSLVGKYFGKARCQAGYECTNPCAWGGKNAFERKI